jgi:hypothetical protein
MEFFDQTPSEYYGLTKAEYDELQALCDRFDLYGGPCLWVALTGAKPGELFYVEQKIIPDAQMIAGYRRYMICSLMILREQAQREDKKTVG